MKAFRSVYGSDPVHLLAVVLSLVVAAVAVSKVPGATLLEFALWFVGAALLHDFALVPAYSLLDRLAGRPRGDRARVNFLRVPAVLSGVLLLVSLGLVLSAQPDTYERATGLRPTPYLERWLVVTAVLLLLSALLYVVRARRLRTRRASSSSTPNSAASANDSASAAQV